MIDPHPAAVVAAEVVEAGWPVVPISDDTDEKRPTTRWREPAGRITRTRDMAMSWPRWAAICGVQRDSDGASLTCLDADGPTGSLTLRSLRSLAPTGCLVRTGRDHGLHLWVRVPGDADPAVRSRIDKISTELDWRGGGCIALLPGSVWAPVSHPEVTYRHVSGPSVAEVGPVRAGLLDAITETARQQLKTAATTRSQRQPVGQVRTDAGSAYERFLEAADRAGRKIIRERPGRAWVSCPGRAHPHGNRKPALLVTAGAGGVGLHCFAHECDHDEITRVLGLTRADLFDPLELDPADFVFTDGRQRPGPGARPGDTGPPITP